MKTQLFATLAAFALAGPALAQGDADKGQREFAKCRACHAIVADDGTEIYKGGRTGPNLYGVIGRTAGTADFRYSASMVQAGEEGLVWDEESFIAYTTDPTTFLRDHLDDPRARGTMTFKLPRGAEDIYAYLVSVGPEIEDGDETTDEAAAQ